MGRLPSIVIPDEPLQIMLRGINDQDIFHREDDYLRFVDDLISALQADRSPDRYSVLTSNGHPFYFVYFSSDFFHI